MVILARWWSLDLIKEHRDIVSGLSDAVHRPSTPCASPSRSYVSAPLLEDRHRRSDGAIVLLIVGQAVAGRPQVGTGLATNVALIGRLGEPGHGRR
jgi:hypothetical protein